MKVKDFVKVLIDVNCSDILIIYDQKDNGREFYYGYVDKKQVYRYLEDIEIDGMWTGDGQVCISI